MAALTSGAGNVETGPVPTGQLKNPYEGDPQAIEYGARIFKRISCHGGNARGGTGSDLTDDEWLRTPTDEMNPFDFELRPDGGGVFRPLLPCYGRIT